MGMIVADTEWLVGPPGYGAGQLVRRVGAEGSGSSGIMLVGEGAGEQEEAAGLPFRPEAEAGSVLARALHRAGLVRESLTICNVVWYRPPRNWLDGAPWEMDAIKYCRPMLAELIAAHAPRVIVALGGIAMRELAGFAGEKQGIMLTRGFVVPSVGSREVWKDVDDFGSTRGMITDQPTGFAGIPVVGTLHPSFLRRGSKGRAEGGEGAKTVQAGGGTAGFGLLGVLVRDLQLATSIAEGKGPKAFTYHDYRLDGILEDWAEVERSVRHNPDAVVSYDFETEDSLEASAEEDVVVGRRPTQVQVSLHPGHAVVSPWTPELVPILRGICESPATKLDWNGRRFDRPILRDLGIRTDVGRWVDVQDMWHHAQPDLPRGLQWATSFAVPEVGPWKHLSASDPLWYGALDVDMPQRVYGWLQASMRLVRNPVSGKSLLEGHEEQVVRVAPVLDRMTARGIPVDEDRRMALDEEFTATLAKLTAEMQFMYPIDLLDLHPKNGFVRVPVEATEAIESGDYDPSIHAGFDDGRGNRYVSREFSAVVTCPSKCQWSRNTRIRAKLLSEKGGLTDCTECGNTGKVSATVRRWAELLPFKPGSWQQVARYIRHQVTNEAEAIRTGGVRYKSPKWYMPKDHKSGYDTTGEAELRRLAAKTGDPLLSKVLEYREVAKAKGTYVDGWKPVGVEEYYTGDGRNPRIGRVHPNWGFKPATGQGNSDSPNAQNFPVHREIARAMNLMIAARPSRVMLKLDWKSFHLVTGAFEAGDAAALRIARVDIHSFLTLVGLLRLERPEVAFGWSDDELRDRLGWYKKQGEQYCAYVRSAYPSGMTFKQIRDALAKRVVYGWEFGQGGRSLYHLNQESFAGVSEAQKCQDALRSLFPKMAQWQKDIRLKADHDSRLVSRYGYVRYFYDVFHRRPVDDSYQPRGDEQVWVGGGGTRWLLKPGDDHEACVAFLPANNAFGIKRRVLAEVGARGWDREYGLISETHDDLRFECEVSKADAALADVKGLMEGKSKVLVDPVTAPDGLWCGVECLRGASWGELQEVHIA